MGAPGRLHRVRPPLLWGAGTLAAVLVVHVWDPNRPGSYGLCPLRAVTGLVCPGCGGLRAVHAMTHGDWATAWGLNPAVVAGLPLAVSAWLLWLLLAWHGRAVAAGPGPRRPLVPWLGLAVVLLYGVLRNVPALEPHLSALT
ncbi:MAG TPA: DUF2752 domain-containing protein [Ornithinicoccus sp.]|nr:DUF2752 domain-containing protein [Ornithinicoccus sp.]